ncbi:unnamed protein product [Trichogramma brassicae]|uniref:Uncharacterized protein n=1 Tax=Trichogramma brassicae TaxID=86971 RepID=A0A6H5J2T9_9HYME|nr:unnamed protein product [Trichogramma brassicae]
MPSSPESKKRKVDEQLGLEKKGSPELSSTKVRNNQIFQQMIFVQQTIPSRMIQMKTKQGVCLQSLVFEIKRKSPLTIRDGFATIIIDTNIFEEELYLIIKRMVSKIRMAVGQALHKLKPQQLKINIVFENNQEFYDKLVRLLSHDKHQLLSMEG